MKLDSICGDKLYLLEKFHSKIITGVLSELFFISSLPFDKWWNYKIFDKLWLFTGKLFNWDFFFLSISFFYFNKFQSTATVVQPETC